MFDWDKFDEIYIYVLIGLLGVPLIYYGFAYFNHKQVLFNFILSIILCLIFIGCIIGYKKGGDKAILGKVLISISIVGGILLGDILYILVYGYYYSNVKCDYTRIYNYRLYNE